MSNRRRRLSAAAKRRGRSSIFCRRRCCARSIRWARSRVLRRLENGKDVILDIDYQGARQIAADAELKQRSLNIFIFPPSFDHLEQRLRDRGLNSENEIQTRLQKAADEIDAGKEFYDYVI